MTVFSDYAACYDLVYRDKDYDGEAAHVCSLLSAQSLSAGTVLELGSDTGGHAVPLATRGFDVTGLDRSEEMLTLARQRLGHVEPALQRRIHFAQADIQDFKLERRFDAAMALFHVISYLADDGALASALACIRSHLDGQGVLVFDFWHAPAVLAQRPETRERTFEDANTRVMRRMRPRLIADRRCVSIDIEIESMDKLSGAVRSIRETHLMRYFDGDELRDALHAAGFDVHALSAWMSHAPPTEEDWSACVVARAR